MSGAAMVQWACAVLIAALAGLRILVTFTPDRHFDIDPLSGEIAFPGFGPSAAMVLDMLSITASVLLLLVRAYAGDRVRIAWIVPAFVPLIAVAWHGARDPMDLALGSTWCAAMFGMVALAHAASDALTGRVLRACLLAVLIPVAARGLMQIEVSSVGYRGAEFAEQIDAFEASKEEFFQSKGWDPDSSSARIFERRLRQAQPAGWFPSTNIFGSLMALAMTMCAVLAVLPGDARARLTAAGAGVIAGMFLIPTGSKGAWAAAAFGLMLAGMAAWLQRGGHRRGEAAAAVAVRWCAVLAVPGVLVAVIVRRWMLPEAFAGERSMLFRGHYLEAAWAMVHRAPIAGVGPDGFGRTYPLVRVARNPEEVTSAHGLFVDFAAALGVFGVFWCALVMMMLCTAVAAFGRRHAVTVDATGSHDHDDVARRHGALIAACAVVVVGAVALRAEAAAVTALTASYRLLALFAAGLVAHRLVAGRWNAEREAHAWAVAGAGGAVVLMVHAQIEMTAVLVGSSAWTMAVLGVAAGRSGAAQSEVPVRTAPSAGARRGVGLGAAAAAIGLGFLLVFGAVPLLRQEAQIADTAAQLRASIPFLIAREGTARSAEEYRLRTRAAEALEEAWQSAPGRVRPVRAAARMLERAAELPGITTAQRSAALERAEAMLGEAIARFPRTELYAQRRSVRERQYAFLSDRAALDRSIEDAEEVRLRDPNGLDAALILARLLREAGRSEELRHVSRRVLEIDAAFALDPLKQLTEAQRAEVREWAESRSIDG